MGLKLTRVPCKTPGVPPTIVAECCPVSTPVVCIYFCCIFISMSTIQTNQTQAVTKHQLEMEKKGGGGLIDHCGGPRVWLKREDLAHTGAHKINNALGQVLLAIQMGKTRIIADTGAGQHGVATATVCARFGLKCVIYMGVEDTIRQRLNVFRMKLLGAEVVPVSSGTQTLKDAMNEAMRDWVTNVATFKLIVKKRVFSSKTRVVQVNSYQPNALIRTQLLTRQREVKQSPKGTTRGP